ncbi:TetR/AcrR family transcriptional regulator [Actinocorallia sp. A-T 12471]|uniref:TetR/AcrR family transcriptional regulator n=1 Tax=Actinocorallia sp. A-T 12471 TaxID=3089813 RepID=UPI0029CB34A2|nr:TetR family transcriptional regulator [Actinocorallia sp. A-T 12471]MDX6741431.1 TetR family transcriptional regulator [Actinocorallia sp. A-T 12471]
MAAQPVTKTARHPGRRRDRAATRAALLDAARRRFGRQGYEGTGLREIAADVGVDPALIPRYFGSKRALYAEAVHVEIPSGLAADVNAPVPHLADALLREVVFGDWPGFDGEHPLVAMLRSAGHSDVRDLLRHQLCDGYLNALSGRLDGPDAALRAELLGALLIGMGVLRSVVGSPALSDATYEQLRPLVARLSAALAAAPAVKGSSGGGSRGGPRRGEASR